MRLLVVVFAALFLAQCAGAEDRRFTVGQSPKALVVIGVAETTDNRDPHYTMLWRRLNAGGTFTGYDGSRIIEPRSNANDSLRVHGIPGEFIAAEVEPGIYALDSVFAVLREDNLDYIAQGVVAGPERPAFEVLAGEAIYLGIWELDVDGVSAVTRPWRLSASDLHAVARAGEPIVGELQARETHMRAVACTPRRLSTMSLRLVC